MSSTRRTIAVRRRRPRGRACGQGANRELADASVADHHSDRSRRQSGHRGAHARQQADRTFRPTGDRREHHPGVGIVGNQMVSKSAPDGYTLAMLTGGFTTQAAVMKSLPYDPIRDFAFVTSVVAYPMFLLVAPNSPIASFKDLIDRARAAPGKVTYAIIGGGSVYHLLGKWIENRAGVEMTAVPYRGSVPAFTDLIGGRLDAMIDTATSAIPRIRNGQLRPLAVSSPERYPLMPDAPTMVETVPGIAADVVAGAGGATTNASPYHRSAER